MVQISEAKWLFRASSRLCLWAKESHWRSLIVIFSWFHDYFGRSSQCIANCLQWKWAFPSHADMDNGNGDAKKRHRFDMDTYRRWDPPLHNHTSLISFYSSNEIGIQCMIVSKILNKEYKKNEMFFGFDRIQLLLEAAWSDNICPAHLLIVW